MPDSAHPTITVICHEATLKAVPVERAEGNVVRYDVGGYTGLSVMAAIDRLMTSYGISQTEAGQLVDMTSACFTVIALDKAATDKAALAEEDRIRRERWAER